MRRTEQVLSRAICSPQSFPGPLSGVTQPLVLEFRSLRVVGDPSLVPQTLRLVLPCLLGRECAPEFRESPGARPPPPESEPRPHPCPSPAALSLSISANRLQTERARRWVNAIGALPGAQATLPARPPPGAARTSQPAPRRPPHASSAPWAAPERHAAEPSSSLRPHSLARRGGSPAGRAQGIRDPTAAGHVSAPCARDPARWAKEAEAEACRARVTATLKCRGVHVRGGSWGCWRWHRPELGGEADSCPGPSNRPGKPDSARPSEIIWD